MGDRPSIRPSEVVSEQLETQDAAQRLQRVALGREILQTLTDVEKIGLTAHRSISPADDANTPRNPSNRAVSGVVQSIAYGIGKLSHLRIIISLFGA